MMNRILAKYLNTSVEIRAAGWFLMAGFLQKGISVITVPIFTRLMNTAEYGRYGVFNSWYGIMSILITLNLSSGLYTQGLVKFKNERRDFAASMQGLTLGMFLIWLVCLIPANDILENLMDIPATELFMMVILVWVTAAFSLWAAEQRVNYAYKILVLTIVLYAILSTALGIILVLAMKDKVMGRILGLLISAIIVYASPILKQLFNGGTIVSKHFWIYALKFNVPLVPHYLSQIVLNSSDRIMIKGMVGEAEAGKYTLIYSVSLIMTIFNTALLNTLHPWVYTKIKNKQTNDIKHVVYSSFALVSVLNLLVIAMAPEILHVFAPQEYYDAIWALPPVVMSVPFIFIYGLFADFEFYYEKAYLASVASVLGASLNLLLNYLLIPVFGYIVAGYTTLFCYVFYAIFHYLMMNLICRKKIGESPYELKVFVLITIAFFIMGFIFLSLYSFWLFRYTLLLMMALVIIIRCRVIIDMIEGIMRTKGR